MFYELGFAHALRKPTILIASSKAVKRIPSDLSGFQYIVYDPDSLGDLIYRVKREAMSLVAREEGPE